MEKRTYRKVLHSVDGRVFHYAERLRKEMFPRRKFQAGSLKREPGENTKYYMYLNVTDQEESVFKDILFKNVIKEQDYILSVKNH